MRLSRRNFFKLAGASTTAAVAGNLGFDLSEASAAATSLRTAKAMEYRSICCFCSGGCGVIAQVIDGKLIQCEGDPDNPSNRGSNCSKGAAVEQTHHNDQRITQPMYRAPGSDRWEVKSWNWTISEIGLRVKQTRDKSIIAEEDGVSQSSGVQAERATIITTAETSSGNRCKSTSFCRRNSCQPNNH